eukprot:1183977-Prorocentrum_minimum.AAC.1
MLRAVVRMLRAIVWMLRAIVWMLGAFVGVVPGPVRQMATNDGDGSSPLSPYYAVVTDGGDENEPNTVAEAEAEVELVESEVRARQPNTNYGPIGRRKRGYILKMDPSDARSAGIFSQWTNQTQEARSGSEAYGRLDLTDKSPQAAPT